MLPAKYRFCHPRRCAVISRSNRCGDLSSAIGPPALLPVYELNPAMSRRWLPLDAGLLGLRSGGILLGSGRLGNAASSGRTVDAWLMGPCRRRLRMAPGGIGAHVGFYGGINYGFGYLRSGSRLRGRDVVEAVSSGTTLL